MTVFVFLLVLLGLLGSCATAPETEPDTADQEQEGDTETVAEAVAAEAVPRPDAEQKQAADLKSRIETYGLDKLAPQEYQAAEEKFADGMAALDKDNAASQKAFEEAIVGYQGVIDKGFPLASGAMKERTQAAMNRADEVKGAVAAKEDYQKARQVHQQAIAAEQAGDYENALARFEQAEGLYLAVYDAAKEKRDRAEASLKESQAELEALEARLKEAADEIESPDSAGQ